MMSADIVIQSNEGGIIVVRDSDKKLVLEQIAAQLLGFDVWTVATLPVYTAYTLGRAVYVSDHATSRIQIRGASGWVDSVPAWTGGTFTQALLPNADNTLDIGSLAASLRAVYLNTLVVGDDAGLARVAANVAALTDGSSGRGALVAKQHQIHHSGSGNVDLSFPGALNTNRDASGSCTLTLPTPTAAQLGTTIQFLKMTSNTFTIASQAVNGLWLNPTGATTTHNIPSPTDLYEAKAMATSGPIIWSLCKLST